MNVIVLLLLIVFLWNLSNAKKCDCGTFIKPKSRTRQNSKIYKGRNAKKDRYPWQIFLLMSSNNDDDICGGTLISTKHILTAAHCFYDMKTLQ